MTGAFDFIIPLPTETIQIARHFKLHEFACKGCYQVRINPRFMRLVDFLEAVREKAGGKRLIVSSGYRCPEHNNATKGAVANSRHLFGDGVDIFINTVSPKQLADYFEEIKFPGVIIEYPAHVHVDLRPNVPVKRRWVES